MTVKTAGSDTIEHLLRRNDMSTCADLVIIFKERRYVLTAVLTNVNSGGTVWKEMR
jgi:hypothetical protein